jgi:WD40 repeat protein
VWAVSDEGEWVCVSTVLHPNKVTSVAWTAPSTRGGERGVRLATGCVDATTRVWRWSEVRVSLPVT